ncbi:MAG: hypothetical protein MZV64_09350 [Ignavibacteriales bacterium]|nr:hypothetical protein [Ignavibacteriales bacterium]
MACRFDRTVGHSRLLSRTALPATGQSLRRLPVQVRDPERIVINSTSTRVRRGKHGLSVGIMENLCAESWGIRGPGGRPPGSWWRA